MRSAHSRKCSACLTSKESFVGLILDGPEFVEDLLWCEELFLYVLVVRSWMMFHPVVLIVEWAWTPVERKLCVVRACIVANGSAFPWLWFFLLHFVVDDSFSSGVVSLEWVSWLFVSHFI